MRGQTVLTVAAALFLLVHGGESALRGDKDSAPEKESTTAEAVPEDAAKPVLKEKPKKPDLKPPPVRARCPSHPPTRSTPRWAL